MPSWWEEAKHTEVFPKTAEAVTWISKETKVPGHALHQQDIADAVASCRSHEAKSTKCQVTWEKGVFTLMEIVDAKGEVLFKYPEESSSDDESDEDEQLEPSEADVRELLEKAAEDAADAEPGTQVSLKAKLVVPCENPDGTPGTKKLVVRTGPIGKRKFQFVLTSPVELGTPNAFISWIKEKFGAQVETLDELAKKVPAELPGVRDALMFVGHIRLVIEELVIDQPEDFYKFGFSLKLPRKHPTTGDSLALAVGPIELVSIGLVVTKKGEPKTED
jgi:hypothetical protein